MNTKDNQRSRLTKMLIKQAYLKLMQEKQPGKITVKELCSEAELNRSTFYLHYQEPNDVLTELEDEIISMVSDYLRFIGGSDEESPNARKYLLSFLSYIEKNADMFHLFLVRNSDPHFRRKLSELSMNMIRDAYALPLVPSQQEYIYHFIVSGCMDVLTEWIKNGFTVSEQFIADLLYNLCEGSIRAINMA